MIKTVFAVYRYVLSGDSGKGYHMPPTLYHDATNQLHDVLIHGTHLYYVPVSVHLSDEEARQECRRRAMSDRALLNPFWFSESFRHANSEIDSFIAQLRELAIWDAHTPGADDDELVWAKWWDQFAPTWSADQRNSVWEVLRGTELYTVLPIDFIDE